MKTLILFLLFQVSFGQVPKYVKTVQNSDFANQWVIVTYTQQYDKIICDPNKGYSYYKVINPKVWRLVGKRWFPHDYTIWDKSYLKK